MEIAMITYDCNDPRSLANFYAKLLDAPIEHASHDFVIVASTPNLGFQRVERHVLSKNRVHLDLRAAPGLEGAERMAALEAEAVRLVAIGATRVERHEPAPPMTAGHLVMRDPEGNEFCLT